MPREVSDDMPTVVIPESYSELRKICLHLVFPLSLFLFPSASLSVPRSYAVQISLVSELRNE